MNQRKGKKVCHLFPFSFDLSEGKKGRKQGIANLLTLKQHHPPDPQPNGRKNCPHCPEICATIEERQKVG